MTALRLGFSGSKWWQGFVSGDKVWLVNGVPEGDGGVFSTDGSTLMLDNGSAVETMDWSVAGDELHLVLTDCQLGGSTCDDIDIVRFMMERALDAQLARPVVLTGRIPQTYRPVGSLNQHATQIARIRSPPRSHHAKSASQYTSSPHWRQVPSFCSPHLPEPRARPQHRRSPARAASPASRCRRSRSSSSQVNPDGNGVHLRIGDPLGLGSRPLTTPIAGPG